MSGEIKVILYRLPKPKAKIKKTIIDKERCFIQKPRWKKYYDLENITWYGLKNCKKP
jgi:hypothetical protein